VLITDGTRVLLLADTDPGIPGSRWWTTPGGGLEPPETPRQAAVRELAEETGQHVAPDALAGPLAVREVVHGYSDQILVQRETFFAWRTSTFDVDESGRTDDERLTLTATAWIRLDALAGLPDPVWPDNLAWMLALAANPPEGPVDLGRVEESTVPEQPQPSRMMR